MQADGRNRRLGSSASPCEGRIGGQVGEVCFEDLIVVTDDGSETLTDFPCDLAP
jgi:hypothetical protein